MQLQPLSAFYIATNNLADLLGKKDMLDMSS